jgi:acetyl-CoA carboxylase biotin carboxyl carrier protein
MTLQEIRELIQLVIETGVAELELQRGDSKLRIKRTHGATTEVTIPAQSMMHLAAHPAPAPTAQPAAVPAAEADPMSDPSLFLQKAPIVGTFYESSKPGAPPFVRIGDTVQKGKTLCIIESMKLMNEIEADESGVVIARLVENGRPVEYGEALFAIKPA